WVERSSKPNAVRRRRRRTRPPPTQGPQGPARGPAPLTYALRKTSADSSIRASDAPSHTQLDLPWIGGHRRQTEIRVRRRAGAERVDHVQHVDVVEQVERLSHRFDPLAAAQREGSGRTQVNRGGRRLPRAVAAHP